MEMLVGHRTAVRASGRAMLQPLFMLGNIMPARRSAAVDLAASATVGGRRNEEYGWKDALAAAAQDRRWRAFRM
jgi:hypothetical protein